MDMEKLKDMKVLSATHRGKIRENNEDRFLVKRCHNDKEGVLLAVADGMGGHAAGEEAARIAVESMEDFDPASKALDAHFIQLIEASNQRIHASTLEKPSLRGMGTTLTAVFLKDERAHWAHVGDTRLYLFRKAELNRITHDHTVPGVLLKKGEITEQEARLHPLRNMLLRCVGCDTREVDTGSFELQGGDIILLSSDGLHDLVAEEIMKSILGSNMDLQLKLDELVSAALNAGGRDNITAVIAQV
jgi:protein phosphatase